jgi:hypothetical protein
MSWVGRTTSRGSGWRLRTSDSSNSKAVAPSSWIGWRTVVSPGWSRRATGMSSKPVTATEPGTATPWRASACSAPTAARSLAQTMARGSGASALASASMTEAPPSA